MQAAFIFAIKPFQALYSIQMTLMKTADFDYHLPPQLIAQQPLEPRDSSRLMLLDRQSGAIEHSTLSSIADYLKEGDVLVFNDSRVIPARLKGKKVDTGGKVELLLLRHTEDGGWEALVKPGKRVAIGTKIEINQNAERTVAEVIGERDGGIRLVSFSDESMLSKLGSVPLPPYIKAPLADAGRYQTVYAEKSGSVAAPTAGLHFTRELLAKLQQKGVECLFVTLHVGLDTFRPVKEEDPQKHPVHREYGIITQEVSSKIARAKAERRRVICVGTTSVRLLEHAAAVFGGEVKPFRGWVDLFILPGYEFRVTDGLVTNFHLPRSTLLMLVSAFAGRELIKKAYAQAIAREYRFYSFGDCMLIL